MTSLFPTVDRPPELAPLPLHERISQTLRLYAGAEVDLPSWGAPAPLIPGDGRSNPREEWNLSSTIPESTMSLERYLQWFANNIAPDSIDMSSPRCLGHMTGVLPIFTTSIAHLVNALNQNLVKVDASPTLTRLERQTLAVLHRLLYGRPDSFYSKHMHHPSSTLGMMAGGGTIANITALWIARNAVLAGASGFGMDAGKSARAEGGRQPRQPEGDGLAAALRDRGYRGAAIIGSAMMHYSIDKAAALLGLGANSLIRIPADNEQRIDLPSLQRVIEMCEKRRWCVLAIVGIAGSTECGSIDPLAEMAAIAAQARTHFHVDAAWGGPLLFSAQHADKLRGIEMADSVTFDGHKQMHLPIGTGMLLLRHPESARLIEKHARYMLHEGSGDLGSRSIEGSREGTALFVHAALNIIGRGGYGTLIDASLARARLMADLIRDSAEFDLILEPQTNIVVYRYIPARYRDACKAGRLSRSDDACISRLNEDLQKAQFAAGHSYVSRTTLDRIAHAGESGRALVALRAVLANPFTTEADLRAVLAEQAVLGSAAMAD